MDDAALPPPTPRWPSPRRTSPRGLPRPTPTAPAATASPTDRVRALAAHLPRLRPAAWLATTGASLLLVASIVVVAGNWDSIDPIVRFSGLVAALLAGYFIAEAGRRAFPTTATALAVLAACLTAPVGIAAAATLGQPWTVCTLIGGVAALAGTHIQSRRWNVGVLRAATVVAFGLGAVGLAGLTGVPAPLIGAIGALGAALAGSRKRTLALASSVGLAPFAVVVADQEIGTGTFARIGMVGDVLIWSSPLSCALAALATGIVAHRLRNAPLAAGAVAILVAGMTTSLLTADAGAPTWLTVFAAALLAAETVGAGRHRSIWRSLARSITIPLAVSASATALLGPLVTILARWGTTPGEIDSTAWCLPFALLCAALVASSVGSARRIGRQWTTLAPLSAASAAITVLACSTLPLAAIAIGAAIVWLIISAVTPWSIWDVTTAWCGGWVALAALADGQAAWYWFGALLVAGFVTVVSCSIVGRDDEGFRAVGAALVTAVVASIVADRIGLPVDRVWPLVVVGGIAIAGAIRPERSLWPLIVSAVVVIRTVDDGTADWFDVVLAGTLALSLAASTRRPTSIRAHLAACCAVVAGALAFAAGGIDAGTATVAASIAGIAMTGFAALDRRLLVGQTAGVAASLVAVGQSGSASPVFMSIAFVVLGAQLVAVGVVLSRQIVTSAGLVLSLTATSSLWWTTGTNQWVIDAVAPYGADGSDIALAAVALALLTAGWLLRRSVGTSTWLAYSPGLGLAGTWLVASQLEPGTDWATFGALVVGVGAVAIGGLRRLGAPLVLGTAMVGATLVVSAGPRLTTAPTWAWIATGGAMLLALAAVIERMDQPLLPLGRRRSTDQISLLEQFCDEFQ